MLYVVLIVLLGVMVPITQEVTAHFRKMQQIKASMLKDELELEKLKYENYLVETEKLRLTLQEAQRKNHLLEDPVLRDMKAK
ncbi:hypothetical protein [Mangrovibacillus cuniculi]|uniref:Uncharacterized protein n=1 Tax=Mangrovibacillus cuniculi TaxID=2593652 RepID=A0A7S8CDX4_9BACI|nr:hypothetical protein [Mangrovibacillus cuniculi]QPC48198.1 hypothetical protein G8O30_15295 [Mangrovibacillus cuniculi]